MKRINKLPRLKKQLSYLEKRHLEKRAKKDKEKRLIAMSFNGVDYQLPSFVIHEIIKFELIRDFIFDNYKIILDCKGIDKQIVNCSKADTCSKTSCKRCIYVFSDVILAIDRLVHNALVSLELFNAKKINERNNLIIQIAQTDAISEEHIKIMLRTRLDNIVVNIHKEEVEINSLIVYLLNAKIRFIDAIEQTVKLYFDYHLNRISYYLENIPTSFPLTPFPSLNRLLEICNSSILAFYDEYREDANRQKTIYEKQGEFLHKTPLALAIVRAEYVTRGVLIDTDATNVDYKNQWVTKREWDAFATALTIARDAMSIVSTEQEMKDEINALDLAISMFASAKKDGLFVDTTMLVNAINIAEAEKKAVIVSDNSAKVYYKSIWVTQHELERLNDSIAEAKAKVAIVRNDEQVDVATNSLTKAITAFVKTKKSGTYVDKSALEAAINKAEGEMENVEISTTATSVDYKKMWVQQDKWESFVSAIATAKNGLSAVSTDDEVNEATDALVKVIKDFISAKKNGNHVDKVALDAVIKLAETEIENISVSTTGSEVDYKKWWVTQNEYDTFRNILKNITRISENVTTDDQVLDATNKLKEEVANLTKIKKKGKFVDKSPLEKALKDAEDAQKDIVIDTDASNVDNRSFWVTRKEYDDLTESIMHAKRRLPSVMTDDEVIEASDSLIKATVAFKSCKNKGTFVDKSILSKEIVKAENSMVGVLIDTNSANVSYKYDWVTQREWDKLTNSIVSAQNSIDNVLTDKQVKNAAKRMRKAVNRFNKSKQKGTFVDTTTLSTVIKNAEAKLEHISVDEDGTNVVIEHLWTTKEEWDLFNLAIEEARNAMNTVKDDEQVVEAVENLTSAIDTFDSVLKMGLVIESEVDDTLIEVVDNVKTE